VLLPLTGLLAGCLHVVSGPDHLAALAPLAVEDPRAAARTGIAWGLGHGLAVVAVGSLALLAATWFDLTALAGRAEALVGVLLIGLGLWALWRSRALVVHDHPHAHLGDHQHVHVHVGAEHSPQAHQGHTHAALGIGALHGVAGTGHLFGVVPALALPPSQAGVYLLAYLVGAVGSMGLFGSLLGRLIQRLGGRGLRQVMAGSGALAIAVGVGWTWVALG
jgi:hypothetical protein